MADRTNFAIVNVIKGRNGISVIFQQFQFIDIILKRKRFIKKDGNSKLRYFQFYVACTG